MAHTNHHQVDLGGYGVVIHPALPNDPPYENDPQSYVTKIFYHKKDYNDLRRKKKRLAKILGKNEGYQFLTYERKWLGRNLPPRVFRLLEEELNESNTNLRNTRFYPIRMLHLGHTLQAIRASPEQMMNAQACSVKHLLVALLHVCETVATLAAHQAVHGDIHAENLLIYLAPPFCDMTLIDYDLFETHEEVKNAYQEGRNYLYGPPEIAHLVTPSVQADPTLLRFYCARLYRSTWLHRQYPRLQDLQHAVEVAIQEHGDRPVSLDQMDSFPLSLLLLDVITTFYPLLLDPVSVSDPDMKALRDTMAVLERGALLSSANRMGPDELVKEIRRILARITPSSEENQKNQENQTRKNQTRKNQENQTRKNNHCVVSGGKQKRAKRPNKTMNISRRDRTSWHPWRRRSVRHRRYRTLNWRRR